MTGLDPRSILRSGLLDDEGAPGPHPVREVVLRRAAWERILAAAEASGIRSGLCDEIRDGLRLAGAGTSDRSRVRVTLTYIERRSVLALMIGGL